MPLWYYRYIDDAKEVQQIKDERKIESTVLRANPETWYSPTRYDNTGHAEQDLCLLKTPTHRVGPIPDPIMPSFHIPLRVAMPKNGQTGGGLEAATRDPVWLSGLWNFAGNGSWEL